MQGHDSSCPPAPSSFPHLSKAMVHLSLIVVDWAPGCDARAQVEQDSLHGWSWASHFISLAPVRRGAAKALGQDGSDGLRRGCGIL